jgi:hypothetical protein
MRNVINYKFILYPILIIFIGGVMCYFPPFIPDYFGVENYTKTNELFNLIISSLVSFMGIYISVSLIAYEFFKQKSGVDFNKSFLLNQLSAYYISFSVLTIIVTFVSSIIVPIDNLSCNEISIIYFNIILFVLIILALIPVAFNLFSSLKPEKLASDEIDKIDSNSIFINDGKNNDLEKSAEIYENDPLLKVTNITIALISVSESLKTQLIILKVTNKLSNLIIGEKDLHNKEYISERLISFYIKIIDFSLLQPNNAGILRVIWSSIELMYFDLIEKKETSFHYEKFRQKFFQRYFSRLFSNNKEEEIVEGIESIKNIIQNQVSLNMPDDNKIIDLYNLRKDFEEDFNYPREYTDLQFKDSKHWGEIVIETFNLFSIIMDKAITLNKPEMLNECFKKLNELNFQLQLKDVGKYKLAFLYIRTSKIVIDYTYIAFEKNVFEKGSDAKNLLPSIFDNLIEKEEISSRSVLQQYCYLLINLQHKNKLDRWLLGGLDMGVIVWEGDLGHVARRCAYNYKKNLNVRNCLEDCIDTYIILKENYELNQNNYFDLYMVLKVRLSTILEILIDCEVENETLIGKLKNQIESFKVKADF